LCKKEKKIKEIFSKLCNNCATTNKKSQDNQAKANNKEELEKTQTRT